MTKLIIDATKDKILLMIIDYNTNYNITYENSKSNYEKLALYINKFLFSKNFHFYQSMISILKFFHLSLYLSLYQ